MLLTQDHGIWLEHTCQYNMIRPRPSQCCRRRGTGRNLVHCDVTIPRSKRRRSTTLWRALAGRWGLVLETEEGGIIWEEYEGHVTEYENNISKIHAKYRKDYMVVDQTTNVTHSVNTNIFHLPPEDQHTFWRICILYGFPCEMDFFHLESPTRVGIGDDRILYTSMHVMLNTQRKVEDHENHARWIHFATVLYMGESQKYARTRIM